MNMRIRLITLAVITSLLVVLIAPLAVAQPNERELIEKTSIASSITFIENVGQFPANVRYYVHGLNRAMWLTDDGVWLAMTEQAESAPAKRETSARYAPYTPHPPAPSPEIKSVISREGEWPLPSPIDKKRSIGEGPGVRLVKITFGSMSRVEPQTRAETIVNFYRTADQATWFTAVPVWQRVRYPNIAPGVDLELWGEGSSLRWQFACDGECADLEPSIEGASNVTLEDDRIVIDAQDNRVVMARPAAPEDNAAALLAGTFFGGNSFDGITAIAAGADGSIYFTGYTGSDDFALTATLPPGTHQRSSGESAQAFLGPIFAGKFKPDLSALTYLTFIGSQAQSFDTVLDSGNDIAVDAQGNAYVAGETASRTFPTTPGAYDRVLNDGSPNNCPTGWLGYPCPDAFAVKLNAAGALIYSTYFGGAQLNVPGLGNRGGNDYGYGLDVDAQGRIILGGETNSDDLPTTSGAYDREFSFIDIGLNTDIFVAKINPAGQGAADLIYSTYVGAGFPNKFGGLDLDATGRVYVAGQVQGRGILPVPPRIDFPRTPNAYPTASQCVAYDCADVFFFKLNPANGGQSDLLYSTFFGGTVAGFGEYEKALDVTVDANGAAYLVGRSDAADYPTTSNALMTYLPGGATQAAFVSKLNPIGSGVNDLVYSTYFGGDGESEASAVVLGSDGHVYVTGYTASSNFPYTAGAFSTRRSGGNDAFLARLKLLGGGVSDLAYSSYLGGSQTDRGWGIAVKDSVAYVAGRTSSSNFPATPGAYDTELDPTYCESSLCGDGYIAQIATGYSTLGGRVSDAQGQPLENVTVTASSATTVAQATTNFSGGYFFNQLLPGTYTVTVSGDYFWTPAQRVITVPPDASSQDFVGSRIVKQSALNQHTPAPFGTLITYTLNVIAPGASNFSVMDVVPTHTNYVSGSLISTAAGMTYDLAANAISGTLNLSAGQMATITFAAQVAITPTETFGPLITNRACVKTVATCEWSNAVINYTRPTFIYLPIVQRN